MDGAKIYFDELFDKQGSQCLTLLEVQQLRGNPEHFQTTNGMWETIKAPTDMLLDIQTRKVCTFDVQSARYGGCSGIPWNFLQGCMETEESSMALLMGKLARLLHPEERLSFQEEDTKEIWVTVDAVLNLVAGM